MCVGSVCTHPSYNDKTPPSVFFQISLFWDSCQNDVVLYRPLPGELIDKPSYLRPALSDQRAVRLRCREDKMSQIKQLRWFVVGCNNKYSSHHLLEVQNFVNKRNNWLAGKCYIATMLFDSCRAHRFKSSHMRICVLFFRIVTNLILFIVSFPKSSLSHPLDSQVYFIVVHF